MRTLQASRLAHGKTYDGLGNMAVLEYYLKLLTIAASNYYTINQRILVERLTLQNYKIKRLGGF